MKNKRGLELAINTVVVLILAIMVLVFAFLFFTNSGQSFLDTIKSYWGYSNVDVVIQGCNSQVNSNSYYTYCCEKKQVKYFVDDKKQKDSLSCLQLLNKSYIGGKIESLDCSDIKCG